MTTQPEIFEQRIVVHQEDLDEMMHVNNVRYLQWIQDVAKAHWEYRARPEWLEQYAWVALSHHIEYKKPAFLGDQLLVQTHVETFEGVKSHRLVRIRNEETQALLVQSSTWWCMLDKATMKPFRITSDMLTHFGWQ